MKVSYTLPENLSPVLRDQIQSAVETNVRQALAEDIGSGDITASLIPESQQSVARIICRDHAVICGRPWFDEVFRQIDPDVQLEWHIEEGERVEPNQVLVVLKGSARSLLTGERAAMNFLQTLSGTATRCQHYANLVSSTDVKLLDTRKTLPGLRVAQKYAVAAGGCHNHRIGLFDAFLIKENHIAACGGIARTVDQGSRNRSRQTGRGRSGKHGRVQYCQGSWSRHYHARQLPPGPAVRNRAAEQGTFWKSPKNWKHPVVLTTRPWCPLQKPVSTSSLLAH